MSTNDLLSAVAAGVSSGRSAGVSSGRSAGVSAGRSAGVSAGRGAGVSSGHGADVSSGRGAGVSSAGGDATSADGAQAGNATWVDRAEAALAASGHRRGGARRAVLELLEHQECALTAQEMEDRLRGAQRRVSRASIYRVLDELESLKLVQRVETGQAMVHYERVCHGSEHHHHLVCERCGVVTPFSDPALERAISSISERVPLDVSEHEIVLRGECRDCAA